MPTAPPDDVRRWLDRQGAERGSLARTWALVALAEPAVPVADTDAAWGRLAAGLDAPARAAARSTDRPAIRPRALRWAVALAAAGGVALTAWLWPTTVAAGAEIASVSLSDGSAVTLAPGSGLVYRRGLRGGVRRVSLDGQALFEVVPDGRPFVVETFNAEVEVLGTTFDVLAWPRGGETAVALLEGAVRLRSDAGAVRLEPGEVSRVEGAGAPTPPVDADVGAAAAWRAGGFSVVDARLAAVTAAVEARFGRSVALDPGVDAGRRLTLFLPTAETADAVLGDVAAYLGLRLQVTSDGFTLRPR